MKILCIGESLVETTCIVTYPVTDGDVITVTDKYECGGGCAGNISYLLSKWGIDTYIASVIGSDDDAEKIKKEYESINLKTDYIETSYDKGTSKKIILLNKTNKNNTTINIANNVYLKKHIFSNDFNAIVTDGTDFNATMAAFDKNANAVKFVIVNKWNNEIAELCRYANYILFDKKSSEQITNSKINFNNSNSLVIIYNALKQKYKADIIITLGDRGSLYSVNGQIKIMPPLSINIEDTNGREDVYAGSFVYAVSRNFGLEKSVCYAAIASSFSQSKITSRLSIPNIVEVSNYFDQKFGKANNPNVGNNDNA